MKKLFASLLVALGLGGFTAPAPAMAQEPFIGEIMMVGETFCPRNWADASGQLMAISQNDALFSLYGTMYGGDGRTTFGLPGLRGRVVTSDGNGPGLSPYTIGSKGGRDSVTLTIANLPAHNHAVQFRGTSAAADTASPGNALLGGAASNTGRGALDSTLNAGTLAIGNNGGNQPVPIVQPTLVMRYCVALYGIYPSRS